LLLVCVLPLPSAHETAGATGTRHSPRPPWGRKINARLGRIASRGREVMFGEVMFGEVMFGIGADTVIPGRCQRVRAKRGPMASNPESRDSGSGPADHPGMTVSGLHVIASEAKQSILSLCGEMDCFAEPVIRRAFRATRWFTMTVLARSEAKSPGMTAPRRRSCRPLGLSASCRQIRTLSSAAKAIRAGERTP